MVSKAPGQSDGGDGGSIDALYVTSDQPHQLALIPEPEDYGFIVQKKTDAVYVTRFQKERWTEKERPYPKIDAKFMRDEKYSEASVMHPLPRVNELDVSLDKDRRAIYFQQAAYGVPVRMALISLLLHLHKNKSLHQFPGGFAKPEHPIYVQPIGTGIQCANANCIVCDPAERQYAANKFYVVEEHFAAVLQAALRLLRDRYRRGRGRAPRRGRHDAQNLFARIGRARARTRREAEACRHPSQRCRSGGRRLAAARGRQKAR